MQLWFQGALLSNLPPPSTDPAAFAQWAQGLVELSEQRGREGEAKGEAKGTPRAILEVLKTRGVAVPAEVEQRIAACTAPALLSQWLKRAVTAIRADDVVAPTKTS